MWPVFAFWPRCDRANLPNRTALASLLDPKPSSRFIATVQAAFDVVDLNRPSSLIWTHTRSLSIAILRPGAIGERRWSAFLGSFEQTPTSRLLLFVLGAIDLGQVQRRMLTRAIGDRRVAALVEGVAGRELVTALSWSGVTIESFPISAVREAIGSLDPESEGEPIEQCLDLAARISSGALPRR